MITTNKKLLVLIASGALFLNLIMPLYALADKFTFVSFEFPPLEYSSENEAPKGCAVNIVKKIMTELGHSVNIQIYPWTRSLNMVKKGTADAIFTIYKNPEREKYLDYSSQILMPQIVYFYAKKESNIIFNGDLESIKDKTIGVMSTISYGQKLDNARKKLKTLRSNTLESNFNILLMDRVELVPSNVYVAEYTLDLLKMTDKIKRLPQEVERVPSYIAFSKKRNLTDLRDTFDKSLIKMKSSGEYLKILKKYDINLKKN